MSTNTSIVLGMWGTSHLSLYLVNPSTGVVKAKSQGPGISMLGGRSPEEALFEIVDKWIEEQTVSEIYLSGMVGSTLGWVDVPYMECPLDMSDISPHVVRFIARDIPIVIIPGLACQNLLGHNDVIRGEETELLGWFSTASTQQLKSSLICIPGTHTKWIKIENGKIDSFLTSVVGEMYQIISANGVLAKPHFGKTVQSSNAFMLALDNISKRPSNLMNLLFTTRANAVRGEFSPEDSTDYLSGLLIGADIQAATDCFGREPFSEGIPLIGSNYLVDRYSQALSYWEYSAEKLSSGEIGRRGLYLAYQQISQKYDETKR